MVKFCLRCHALAGISVVGIFLLTAIAVLGCSQKRDVASLNPDRPAESSIEGAPVNADAAVAREQSSANPPSADSKQRSPDKRRLVAGKAKDALFQRLSARLMEVIQSEGPAAAIHVCSQEATQIAEAVGDELGVQIGRTSFKLRNPDNAPRDWVQPFVQQRADTPQFTRLDEDRLGAIFPIHLNVKCLMCHGQEEDILDSVQSELAQRYPDDRATGFSAGDLRGWFWVEVPAAG